MDREDFETSRARSRSAGSRTKTVGNVTKDFKAQTGKWLWWPETTERFISVWNPEMGPALSAFQRVTYWLCLGWSRIEIVAPDDPRDGIQNGGHDGGA